VLRLPKGNTSERNRCDMICRENLPNVSERMKTITLTMPPERIALFKAIVESYDNLATLRTEDPQQHHLKLYFSPTTSAEVEALLDSLRADFAIRHLAAD
jgi:Domain of unknown function (DUF4911)